MILVTTVMSLTGVFPVQVVAALKPHGLTLQNFASIKEQTIGGFTQAGCHGTGARIPPVDEQVVAMRLVTPAKGCLDLSAVCCHALLYNSAMSMSTGMDVGGCIHR